MLLKISEKVENKAVQMVLLSIKISAMGSVLSFVGTPVCVVSALWGESIGSKTPQDPVEYCKINQPAFEI